MTRLLFINPSKTLNAAHSNYKRKFRLKLFRLNDIQPILDKSFVSPYIPKNDKICSVKNQNLKKIVFYAGIKQNSGQVSQVFLRFQLRHFLEG